MQSSMDCVASSSRTRSVEFVNLPPTPPLSRSSSISEEDEPPVEGKGKARAQRRKRPEPLQLTTFPTPSFSTDRRIWSPSKAVGSIFGSLRRTLSRRKSNESPSPSSPQSPTSVLMARDSLELQRCRRQDSSKSHKDPQSPANIERWLDWHRRSSRRRSGFPWNEALTAAGQCQCKMFV